MNNLARRHNSAESHDPYAPVMTSSLLPLCPIQESGTWSQKFKVGPAIAMATEFSRSVNERSTTLMVSHTR